MKHRMDSLRGLVPKTVDCSRVVLNERLSITGLIASPTDAHPMVVRSNEKELLRWQADGSTIFFANGEEMFRFHKNGHCYVKGHLVAMDETVYKTFKEWLKTLGFDFSV